MYLPSQLISKEHLLAMCMLCMLHRKAIFCDTKEAGNHLVAVMFMVFEDVNAIHFEVHQHPNDTDDTSTDNLLVQSKWKAESKAKSLGPFKQRRSTGGATVATKGGVDDFLLKEMLRNRHPKHHQTAITHRQNQQNGSTHNNSRRHDGQTRAEDKISFMYILARFE